jgi:hypothetical protein
MNNPISSDSPWRCFKLDIGWERDNLTIQASSLPLQEKDNLKGCQEREDIGQNMLENFTVVKFEGLNILNYYKWHYKEHRAGECDVHVLQGYHNTCLSKWI